MRLSEFSVSHAFFEAIKRCRERGTITLEEEREICKEILESIKGNNTQVEDFIKVHVTPLPVTGNRYFPVGVAFFYGLDKIEITYVDSALEFVCIAADDFIYTDSVKKHKFPPTIDNSAAAVTTFHCQIHNESKEIRSMIYLTFGDCEIINYKI